MSIFNRITDNLSGKSYTETGKPDGDMQAVLDALAALGAKPVEQLTPEAARAQPSPADAVAAVLREHGKPPAPAHGVTARDFEIPGPAGPIKARLYEPEGDRTRPRPVVGYWHGGGWVIADLDVYDASPRAIAHAADCIVVSFHYRQAPEHKFPAAHEDAFAAYRWLLDHAAEIHGDPDRIAVVGESAGGNLAANVAIMARDAGIAAPVHQVLVYPVAGADMETESYTAFAQAAPLSKAGMAWFVSHVFADHDDVKDPRIDLVNATLEGLPPTTIINAEIDPLLSDGELLAERLREADVHVDQRTFLGVTHEFFGMGAVSNDARDAVGYAAHHLKHAFGTSILPM